MWTNLRMIYYVDQLENDILCGPTCEWYTMWTNLRMIYYVDQLENDRILKVVNIVDDMLRRDD